MFWVDVLVRTSTTNSIEKQVARLTKQAGKVPEFYEKRSHRKYLIRWSAEDMERGLRLREMLGKSGELRPVMREK